VPITLGINNAKEEFGVGFGIAPYFGLGLVLQIAMQKRLAGRA
jgi:hypothetical protein